MLILVVIARVRVYVLDEPEAFLAAASCMTVEGSNVFDSTHAVFCGTEGLMISFDKIFDRLGVKQILLGADAKAA